MTTSGNVSAAEFFSRDEMYQLLGHRPCANCGGKGYVPAPEPLDFAALRALTAERAAHLRALKEKLHYLEEKIHYSGRRRWA